jgi:hypothetical protein
MQKLTDVIAKLTVKESVTKEQKDFAIDAIISMVVDDLASEFEEDSDKVLTNFICSNTGKLLYDEESECWKNGPTYVEDLYKGELKKTDDM